MKSQANKAWDTGACYWVMAAAGTVAMFAYITPVQAVCLILIYALMVLGGISFVRACTLFEHERRVRSLHRDV